MQDLHKPNYLDAKMELGTQVQFFSFTLTSIMLLFNGFSVSNATSIKFDTNILHRGIKPL